MYINKLLFSLFLLHSTITLAADEIHWTIMGQTSVTFDWRGTFIENSIHYGTTPGIYNNSVDAFSPTPLPFSSLGPFWEAKITNLEENTRYYYSIGDGVEGTFKTPPPLGSSGFTIFAEGDIGDTVAYIQVAAIQEIIANAKPDFVVAVGDLSYGNPHGQAAVDQHFNDVMVWSLDAAYMPVWGNHEWDIELNDDLRNYKGRFDLPNSQTSPDSPLISCCGEDWYWYDYGNVRFIALPEPWSGDWTDWSSHAIALMEEAQATQDITFIVTFVHRPAYSSAHHPGARELKQVLDNLGDNFPKYVLNINGHSHNYERSHPLHGVVHITAGASGATLQSDGLCLWLICEQPTWSAFRTMHLGALKLDFSADSIKGTYICGPVGEGTTDIDCILGDVVDNFTIKISHPTDDASIKPGFPTKNYGSKKLEADNEPVERILMKFNVLGVEGQSIQKAKLRLYNINESAKGGDFHHLLDNSWSESTVTWNNAPAAEQTIFASLDEVSSNNWYEVDLTSVINEEGTYSLEIVSTSNNGADYHSKETQGFSPQLLVTYDDTIITPPFDITPPSVPTHLNSVVISDSQVNLFWSESTDNISVSGYHIYRDNIKTGTTPINSFSDTELTHSTSYTYTVSAFDEAGNTSSNSAITTATTPNKTEPTLIYTPTDDASIKPDFPTKNYGSKKLETDNDPKEDFLIKFNISGTNGQSISNAKLRLYCINGSPQGGNLYIVKDNSWSESSITWDNAPAAQQFPLASLGPVSANNWYDINLTPLITSEGIYSFTISSTSRNGADYYSKETKEFAPQLIITFDDSTIADVTPPSTPTDLTATVMSDTQIILSWSSSIDNKRISGYNIYQDDIHIGTTLVTSFSITGLAPSTSYAYTISAYDEAENTSSNSPIIIATTHSIAPTETEFTRTYTPTDDATIKPGFPIKNFGSRKLEADSDPEEHILIKFNVSGTNGQAIASAKLFLYSINGSPKGGDFYHIIDNSWSESTVTWNNAPVAEPNLLVSLGAVSVNDWHEIDLTSLIRSEGIYSLRISSTSRNGTDYNSKEASNFKPQLIITLEELLPEDLLIDD